MGSSNRSSIFMSRAATMAGVSHPAWHVMATPRESEVRCRDGSLSSCAGHVQFPERWYIPAEIRADSTRDSASLTLDHLDDQLTLLRQVLPPDERHLLDDRVVIVLDHAGVHDAVDDRLEGGVEVHDIA